MLCMHMYALYEALIFSSSVEMWNILSSAGGTAVWTLIYSFQHAVTGITQLICKQNVLIALIKHPGQRTAHAIQNKQN